MSPAVSVLSKLLECINRAIRVLPRDPFQIACFYLIPSYFIRAAAAIAVAGDVFRFLETKKAELA